MAESSGNTSTPANTDSVTKEESPASDDEEDYDWENYKKKYGKIYSPEEETKRQAIFNEKILEIKKINALYAEGKSTFKAGVNHLTDLTSEEYGRMCGFRMKE